ncbi:MAG: hypothetical protein LC114_10145 [Bryobacterales bacterium]|nr:hypothetical protein [Bryobacterales bacterium]
MENPWVTHIEEEQLERYAMGTLPELEAAIEEHSLSAYFRDRLTVDEFLNTLRSAENDPVLSSEPDHGRTIPPDESSFLRKCAE